MKWNERHQLAPATLRCWLLAGLAASFQYVATGFEGREGRQPAELKKVWEHAGYATYNTGHTHKMQYHTLPAEARQHISHCQLIGFHTEGNTGRRIAGPLAILVNIHTALKASHVSQLLH